MMQSFHELLKTHAPILWIDSASMRVQVGLIGDDSVWKDSDAEAASGIFSCVEEVLDAGGLQIKDIGAFVFCEGPGSILGIRMAAVAIRLWLVMRKTPVFSYKSLDLAANALKREDVLVIADARRESWHVARIGEALRRVSNEELSKMSGTLVMPEGFRHWGEPPRELQAVSYNVEEMLEKAGDIPLLHENNNPDAFLHEEPSYVKWSPQVHRAPGGRE